MDLNWGLFFPPEDIWSCLEIFLGFPGGSVIMNQCAMQELQEMQVQSLGWEDPLEEGMEIHSSILAWRIPMDRGAWRSTVHGVAKSWTQLSNSHLLRQPLEKYCSRDTRDNDNC